MRTMKSPRRDYSEQEKHRAVEAWEHWWETPDEWCLRSLGEEACPLCEAKQVPPPKKKTPTKASSRLRAVKCRTRI